MGLKQTIKGWFTKQSRVDLTGNWQSRSINGLYTANNKDLNKIATKVNEIENVINNLPPPTPPVDLTEYAKKNIDNDFVNQSIKGNSPYLQFKAANGVRVGYTGNPSAANNNIETKAEHGDYYASARENVVLNPTNGNAIYSKAPTDDTHVANKAYVDQQINTADQSLKGLIQAVKNKADNLENEMLNVPKLAGLNSFTGTNTFGTHVIIGNNDAKYVDPNYTPVNDGEFASKRYVDQNVSGKFSDMGGYNKAWSWIKGDHIANKIWVYTNIETSLTINIPPKLQGKNLKILLNISCMDPENIPTPIGFSRVVSVNNSTNSYAINLVPFRVISHYDYNVGSSGTFTGRVLYDYVIVEV